MCRPGTDAMAERLGIKEKWKTFGELWKDGRLFSDKIDIAANGFDSVIPTMLSGLPDILIGVVVILVLSASMSTLSSLVLTSSSTITLDLIRGHVFKKLEEKNAKQNLKAQKEYEKAVNNMKKADENLEKARKEMEKYK